jgi:hypothetical protein
MFGKDGSAELVSLAEGDGTHSGSLEPETESADSAEEVEDTHYLRSNQWWRAHQARAAKMNGAAIRTIHTLAVASQYSRRNFTV